MAKAKGLLLLATGALLLSGAHAEPAPPPTPVPAYAQTVATQVEKVYQGPDFMKVQTHRELGLRPWVKTGDWSGAFDGFWEWLRKLFKPGDTEPKTVTPPDLGGLIIAFKLLALALAAAFLFWLLRLGYRHLSPMLANRAKPLPRPLPAAELQALSPSLPLPPDIAAEARRHWQAGNATLALSLLYRGAVQGLGNRYQLRLPASATEGECLRLARHSGLEVVPTAFAPIVQAWQALAYARRQPEDFEALARLFDTHFRAVKEQP